MKYCLLSISCMLAMLLHADNLHAQKEQPLSKEALQNITEGRILAYLDLIHATAYPYFAKMATYNNMPTIYIPYVDGDTDRLIVYTPMPNPKVIYAVALTNLTHGVVINTSSQVRDFTPIERELYTMMERTLLEFKKETFFRMAENSYPKLRPVITPYGHKLYLYGDPICHDTMTFGEDYVVEFDQDNQFITKKVLHMQSCHVALQHRNLPDTVFGYHTHETEYSDDFTATDVAKVIYYQTIAGWNNFVLKGKHFITFWDYKKDRPIQYDKFEFEDAYSNKPYHGKYLVVNMPIEKQDSGQIPLTTEMEQIAADGRYLANMNIVTDFCKHYADKQAQFRNQNLFAFSYLDGYIGKTVFFKAGNLKKVFATVSFDERYDSSHLKIDYQNRNFTPNEAKLYKMYAAAWNVIQDYDLQKMDTTLVFVIQPVITRSSQKVYVSTESIDPKKLLFGPDFYVEFDKHKDYLKIVNLHNTSQNLAQPNHKTVDTLLGIHSHTGEADDFLTATDICKILTYRLRAGWSNFLVKGKKHFCFWDYEKNKPVYWDDEVFKTLYIDKPYHGKMIFNQVHFF